MRVLHLNFSAQGGAGVGVQRLNKALLIKKIHSKILNYDEYLNENNFFPRYIKKIMWNLKIIFKKILVKFFVNFPHKETISLNIFNNLDIQKIIDQKKFDLVHLHWIGNEMISLKEINKINIPIVWTMHDMWAFCGGEHFAIDKRFQRKYSKISRSKKESGIDLNRIIWKKKEKYLERKNIQLISPSNWMNTQVKKSSLFKNKKSKVLPYIINTNEWSLNLKKNKKIFTNNSKTIILFSATSSVNFRKGFNYLVNAINDYLDHKNYYLIVAGDKPKQFDQVKIEKKFVGKLDSNRMIKNIYYSSDIFVMPSLYESFGQVFIEAGCYGLPSVAFKKTAVEDILNHKKNGYLANYKSSKDLAKGIDWARSKINRDKNFKYYNRKFIIDNFSYETRTIDYINLYKKIIRYNKNSKY